MKEISSMVISHKKATIQEMELSWTYSIEDLILKLYKNIYIFECIILKTCNRAEIYVVSENGNNILFQFAKELKVSSKIIEFYNHNDTINHLMRLSCGLESMIVGEDQILGQIKSAYLLSEKLKTVGPILSSVFKKVIQVGKRARSETLINKGSVSIGSAAVDLAEKYLSSLKGKTILVIGVGEIGILVAKALSDRELSGIYISNRTFEKAESLASDLGGKAIKFENMESYLKIADVVISATSAPHFILSFETIDKIMKDRSSKPLFIIDIANPRDVEESVGFIKNVTLCNIDNLRILSIQTLNTRKEESKKVLKIIDEEIILLDKSLKSQKANSLISQIYKKFEIIKNEELKKAIIKLMSKKHICIEDQKIVQDLVHVLVNKILCIPTKKLKEAAEKNDDLLLNSAYKLFELK